MNNPVAATRQEMVREAGNLRELIRRLRQRETSLSFLAEQGGPLSPEARSLSAALQCILADQLGAAADALEREAENGQLLPDEPDEPLLSPPGHPTAEALAARGAEERP